MAKKERKKREVSRLERLKHKYRFILLDESTFDEQFAIAMTPLNFILTLLGVLVLVIVLVSLIFFYTPVREMIPGYSDDQLKADAEYARMQTDSLINLNQKKELYIKNLQIILQGGLVENIEAPILDSTGEAFIAEFNLSGADSALRAKLQEEDQYNLNLDGQNLSPSSPSNLLLFKPLNGSVSGVFDSEIGHFGIDIVAPANSLIKSVLEGTVITSTWTTSGGNVIQIQHPYNLVSVYKHNSVLLKKEGEQVDAGDPVAIIGDSGEESDGPHLHFELWRNGVPVNPADYFLFEE